MSTTTAANGPLGASDVTPHPTVSVVIATRDRPTLLRRAVEAVMAQDYPGDIECLVVFDRCDPHDVGVQLRPGRSIQLLTNTRTPGLAGARNSGILAASGQFVAFCDDDDEWLEGKASAQVPLLLGNPDAVVAATGITIRTEDADHVRIGPPTVSMADYLVSRVTEIHPSTFMLRRADLLGRIGLVDESVPASYGEDYELLLRASRVGITVNVEAALVNIYWNRPSFFAGRWDGIANGLTYVLERYPEFRTVPAGRARLEGQVAFAHAAAGRRREALRWAGRTLRHDPRQLRGYAAVVVGLGILRPARLVELVQARGKGL